MVTLRSGHPARRHSPARCRNRCDPRTRTPRTTPPALDTGSSKFDTFPWHQALDQAETQRHLRDQSDGQQQVAPQSAL